MPLPRLNIFEKMRGIFSPVTDLRRRILTEVARMVVTKKKPKYIDQIPFNIITKDTPTYRESVFKERAIVRERIRLAFGMPLKEFGAHGPINDDDVIHTLTAQKILTRPIVNVIKIGCERCPEHSYFVTDLCRGCIAHPCVSVCPKNAVTIVSTPAGPRSVIDQKKCIQCGKCEQVCPYNAISYRERPCAAACGVNAITSDELGFADIDYEKCTSCGLCIVSCPFAAIAEKSEIVQILKALQSNIPVIAEIAPLFPSQFGPLAKPEIILQAISLLGFKEVHEVAYGADITILNESEELKHLIEKCNQDPQCLKKMDPEKERTFVGTSCCTAWSIAARNNFPQLTELNISESFTPMVETAKIIKKNHPDAIIVFIGPCIAKKEESFDPYVKKYVDFVMTYEELAALFQAYTIDPTELSKTLPLSEASQLGRGFPVAGGVVNALIRQVTAGIGSKVSIPVESADTLKDCMQMLKKIKHKKFDPMPLLVEGMACPHGCVGGPGTLATIRRAQRSAFKFAKEAEWDIPSDHVTQN